MAASSKSLKPRKTPVQARAVETRERILDSAARVFSAHGYASGTTNRIAAEAGMSVGSLYQYFPNKDAILVELVRRHVAAGAERFQRLLAHDDALPTNLESWIELAVDAFVANHVDDPALHQVLFEQAPRPGGLLAELHAVGRQAIDTTAAILRTLPEVRVEDLDTAARIVVVTIESLVHRVVATRDRDIDVAVFRDELVRMLVCYLSDPTR